MFDLSHVNDAPGPCGKCSGSGEYRWGLRHSGQCNACRGKGYQTRADMARNAAFNRHQVRRAVWA